MKRYVKLFEGFDVDTQRKIAVVRQIIDDGVEPSKRMIDKGWVYSTFNSEPGFEDVPAICFVREFNYGEAIIDITPFRQGSDEIRPLAWINGNEVDIPDSYTIKNPSGFDRAMNESQKETLRRLADSVMQVVDEDIMNVILDQSDSGDLFVFGGKGYETEEDDVEDFIEYFDGEVDWHPNISTMRRSVKSKRLFGI